jgi:hypothetical protein
MLGAGWREEEAVGHREYWAVVNDSSRRSHEASRSQKRTERHML